MKVIQLGVGGFGRRWLPALNSSPDVEVVALVDVNQEALTAACTNWAFDPGICYPSLTEALENIKAEFLVCVSPPDYHREHAVAAMEAGLHVLCEKPMANNMVDCKAMLAASRETGQTLAISQNYRYRSDTWTMANMVQNGRIGPVGQVKLDFYKGIFFGEDNFRTHMPYPTIIDMSIHHFDLLRFITGLEAVSVRGEAWNPSWSLNAGDTSNSLTFTMNNGARLVYNASWCAQGDFCNWNGDWLIEGDAGSIVYTKGAITLNQTDTLYKISETETTPPIEMPLSDQEWMLSHFIESIQTNQKPQTNATDNIRSIAMVFAAVTAVQTGESVPILDDELTALLTI